MRLLKHGTVLQCRWFSAAFFSKYTICLILSSLVNLRSSSALAAVGACAALTNVFICVALGAGVGAGVLVSRYFGAKEYGKMKTIVSTSLLSFLILSIALGVFAFLFSHSMIGRRISSTPADILDDAVLYRRV